MCHVSHIPSYTKRFLDIGLIPKLNSLSGCCISIGSGYEPMVHPEFAELVGKLSKIAGKIQIITNGTLLNRKNLDALTKAKPCLINFSFDGCTKKTYETIRNNARFQHVVKNILNVVKTFKNKKTIVTVNYTLMRDTLIEASAAVDFWNKRGIDMIRFLLMVVRYPDKKLVQNCLYPLREQLESIMDTVASDIVTRKKRIAMELGFSIAKKNSLTPYFDKSILRSNNPKARVLASCRQAYLYENDKNVPHFKCRGAYNSATILANGDIQICFKYTIGNLHNSSFEEIWFSSYADEIRSSMATSHENCMNCDCYKFGIAYHDLKLDDIKSYFASELLPWVDTVDFESGKIDVNQLFIEPKLVEVKDNMNIIYYAGYYIAAPHSLGSLDLRTVDFKNYPGLVCRIKYEDLMSQLIKLG
ncbi:MAG: hypothetical protein AUJ74_06295 [Candidatus Omnitrophica bacterium CG1_02_44_16]|nr:MAG: hypothetical protein AUJ74_06295 [Candidatus Omnitrophica bacterium CG1_02_44_16]